MLTILLLSVLLLSYANGANDNFKGVATLYGSGTTTFKQALTWSTFATFLGSIVSIVLAYTLVENFSGKGLVPDEFLQQSSFASAVALGAAITVFIATKIGMPVSTTHALVGALVGSGLMAAGSAVNLLYLAKNFVLPLIVSPLFAGAVSFILIIIFHKLRVISGLKEDSLVGTALRPRPLEAVAEAQTLNGESKPTRLTSETNAIELRVRASSLLNALHFTSSGIVCFARGLNDTPKIIGLLLIVQSLNIYVGMICIAVAIVFGGLIHSRKVAETVSRKITSINDGQGFTANLVTGLLVTTASLQGLPVSTTHVAVGSFFGIATFNKNANTKTMYQIVSSWVLTLPVAAVFGALIYFYFDR